MGAIPWRFKSSSGHTCLSVIFCYFMLRNRVLLLLTMNKMFVLRYFVVIPVLLLIMFLVALRGGK